ncbi:MAG: insulinase family protein [Patescibacteria group bacterium]|nr:insulinase family protein [Patescibacteria group bacterium]
MANKIKFKKNQIIHNWKILNITEIKDLKIDLIELEHIKTKAKYIHIANEDKENAFAVAFKTIPEDSTGIAHILEHTVLTGSKKYPVRDPFFSMIKKSMNTFMNAFTSNDWTAYPFATQNKKDFYNLLSVYLDAAFFPLISELNFKQEGSRLEFDNGELVYKGVVYNEMKGAMSSPESIMAESVSKSLFPNSSYRFNSGGEPEKIVDLTHKELKAFHKKFYHPSNGYFYSYGNLPPDKHLKFINKEIMRKFKQENIKAEVKLEPRWNKEQKFKYKFPIGANENEKEKYQACLAWVLARVDESEEVLVLELLEDILLASPSAPLRNALISSELGSDLADYSGLDTDFRQVIFSCGLKGIKEDDINKVKKIILSDIKKIIQKGLDEKIINSSLQKLEFSHKEVSNHPYPYGLKIWLRFLLPYIHCGSAAVALNFNKDIARIKKNLEKAGYLEKKLEKYFLNNLHRAFIVLEPDKKIQIEQNKKEKLKLARVEKNLKKNEREKIIADTLALKNLQEKEEDLSCLPVLRLSDVPQKIKKTEKSKTASQKQVFAYAQATNGLFYLSSVFTLRFLPREDLNLLPLFCHLLPLMGTKSKNYIEFSEEINACTGGINFSAQAFLNLKDKKTKINIAGSTKCLSGNIKKTYDIYWEIIKTHDFSDLDALKRFLLEYVSCLELNVVENGHIMAMSMAGKNLSASQYLNENWYGVSQLKYIKKIAGSINKEKLKKLADRLTAIGDYAFKGEFKLAHIGDEQDLLTALKLSKLINSSACTGNEINIDNLINCKSGIFYKKYPIAANVSFVGSGFRAPEIGRKDAPALFILSKILGRQFFHTEIREKGGAYGGIAKYDYTEGVFSFGSYRDPHIVSTLKTFARAKNFILNNKYTEKNIQEAILQACSDLDRPGSPFEEAKMAFTRSVIGLSDRERLAFKKGIFKVKRVDINKVAKKYLRDNWRDYNVGVLSSREKLEEVNGVLESGECF